MTPCTATRSLANSAAELRKRSGLPLFKRQIPPRIAICMPTIAMHDRHPVWPPAVGRQQFTVLQTAWPSGR